MKNTLQIIGLLLFFLPGGFASSGVFVKFRENTHCLKPGNGLSLEEVFRKYLVSENVVAVAKDDDVSNWAAMENCVRHFKNFLTNKKTGNSNEVFEIDDLIQGGSIENTAQHVSETLNENSFQIEEQRRLIEQGRPASDPYNKLQLVGSSYDKRSNQTIGVFLHTETVKQVDSVLERFTVRQANHADNPNFNNQIPFTDFECISSRENKRGHGSCDTETYTITRGDGFCMQTTLNVFQTETKNIPTFASPLKSKYSWIAHNRHLNTSMQLDDILLSQAECMILDANIRDVMLQLSPRKISGMDTRWIPRVEGDNLSFLRRCKEVNENGGDCLGVSVVFDPIFLLHRTEPETFGHVLVDSIYSSMWSIQDIFNLDRDTHFNTIANEFVEKTTLNNMKYIFADPFELTRNDHIFNSTSGNTFSRNGDSICEEGNICRIEQAYMGIGCKGMFFPTKRYVERRKLADKSRKRMLETIGRSQEIKTICRLQVTIVLRKPTEGRAFEPQDVSELIKRIDQEYGIPVRTVYMQDLSLQSQMRILHDTSVLIAMDGSVLDLIPVMRDSAAVIAIVPAKRTYLHWRLFQSLTSRYNYSSCIDKEERRPKSFYVLSAPLCTGSFDPKICSLPVDAILVGLHDTVLKMNNLYSSQQCKNWWYFSSDILETISSNERNYNWRQEFYHFNVQNSISSGHTPKHNERESHFCPRWYPKTLDRDGLLKLLRRNFNSKDVLEIGCTKTSNGRFTIGTYDSQEDQVENFVCVDPLLGKGEYRVTSDDFFKKLDGNEKKFDLVFVDGLHTSLQAMRDITNSLLHLAKNGVVAIHDTNPRHRIESENTYFGTSSWNGDVWRAIIHLQQNYGGLIHIATLPFDWGVTLIRFGSNNTGVALDIQKNVSMEENIYTSLPYSLLNEHREKLLNMISLCELEDFFKS